jgi:hypothetical protein
MLDEYEPVEVRVPKQVFEESEIVGEVLVLHTTPCWIICGDPSLVTVALALVAEAALVDTIGKISLVVNTTSAP